MPRWPRASISTGLSTPALAASSPPTLRREVYGEDLGQQGWRSAAEQAEIADLLRVGPESHVLDVACGAGGPSVALVERTGCRLTGLDAEGAGIAYAKAHALARGLKDRATFLVQDCAGPLPFASGTFDAVVCIDAICHLPDRFATLSEWGRLLRRAGACCSAIPAVVTGAVAKSALDIRAATGFFLFVPPGLNEDAIQAAHLTLVPARPHGGHRRDRGSLACRPSPTRCRPATRGGRGLVRSAATIPRHHGRPGQQRTFVAVPLRGGEATGLRGGHEDLSEGTLGLRNRRASSDPGLVRR